MTGTIGSEYLLKCLSFLVVFTSIEFPPPFPPYQITFPRAAGTCTRCPTEVRLWRKEKDWSCKVSLRFEKDANGAKLDNLRIVPFGDPITDPSKVQHRLIQAQKAILNPNKPVESFLTVEKSGSKQNGVKEAVSEASDANEVQFSENIICIDVEGNNVRDLAVVDLPGLIANVGENEDPRNIDLIKNLARKEIVKENCVILLCVTMSGE